MQSLDTLGSLISLLAVLLTLVGSLVAIRVRRTSAKYKRQQEVQERLVQATDWIFQTRMWASRTGQLNQLPELPQILRYEYVAAKAEEEPASGPYTNLAEQMQKALQQLEGKAPFESHHSNETTP